MNQSESIKNIAAALAKAQAQTSVAKKSSTNPHFKSEYADLLEVWGASREALTDNGISVLHLPDMAQDGNGMLTREAFTVQVQHESGEWIRSTVTQMDKPQQFGSFFTYLKRYSLSGVAAVVAEGEDDDGNAAQRSKAGAPRATGSTPPSGGAPRTPTGAPATSSGKPSEKQIAVIFAIAKGNDWDPILIQEWMTEQFGVDSTKDLTGGKDGTASKLISAMKDGTIADWMQGGSPPDDAEPPHDDSDVPY